MTLSSTGAHKFGHSKALHTVVFVIAMISFTLNNSNARAATVMSSDYRLTAAADNFDDAWLLAAASKKRPPRRLRVKRH